MKNAEVVSLFMEIADILDILGESSFKSRAYRKAAQSIKNLSRDLSELEGEGTLEEVPGVGKEIALKIKELLASGQLGYYHKIKSQIPEGLLEIIKIPGIGPKTAKMLYEKLGIASIPELEKAVAEGKLINLTGFKEKTRENIIKGLDIYKKGRERAPLGVVWEEAQALVARLKELKGVAAASAAGSVRRLKETVKDLDLVASSTNPQQVIDAFTSFPAVKEVLAAGGTEATVALQCGINADLMVVNPESYGALLAHLTGSWAHNLRVRELAQSQGLKANEYGMFEEKTGKKLAGSSEEGYYRVLGLPLIPPELREDGSEVDAALAGKLPHLVEAADIKGDLQLHTDWSDGAAKLEEVVESCHKRGYQYLVITDHSKSLLVAHGLEEDRLMRQIDEIRRLNERYSDMTVLAGSEVDILGDGSLDYPDELLAQLDFVLASIHSGFARDKRAQTKRISKAMENRYVNLIGHISGRLIGEREPYELDYEEIFRVARDTNTFIEINAYPLRLDLSDVLCRRARQLGVGLAITSDAHNIPALDQMWFGVAVARRAWLRKEEILNCLDSADMVKAIKKH